MNFIDILKVAAEKQGHAIRDVGIISGFSHEYTCFGDCKRYVVAKIC